MVYAAPGGGGGGGGLAMLLPSCLLSPILDVQSAGWRSLSYAPLHCSHLLVASLPDAGKYNIIH